MTATNLSLQAGDPIPSAVVTGATGFMGRRLVSALVERGTKVSVVVRRETQLPWPHHAHVRQIVSDGSTSSLVKGLHAVAADDPVVFHLASYFVAEHAPEDITPLVESNLHFGVQLLEAMTGNDVRRIVYAGTSWQHFGQDGDQPVNLYAATKTAYSTFAAYYSVVKRLQATQLSLFDVYGPGDPRPKLLPALLRSLVNGDRLAMSAGEQALDLLFVDDAVEAFIVAGKRLLNATRDAGSWEEFMVGSGHAVGLRDLVKMLEDIAGRPAAVDWGQRPYREREVMSPWRTGKSLPGWEPQIDLREGLSRTLNSYCAAAHARP